MRRKDRAVTERADILAILAKCEVMRLGLCADGRPYIVPLNFAVDVSGGGVEIFFHCAPQGQKIDMLTQNPRACFEVDCGCKIVRGEVACNWTALYESVIGEGIIEIVPDAETKKRALDLIMAKYGFAGAPVYSEEALARVCVLRLVVETMSGKRNAPKE